MSLLSLNRVSLGYSGRCIVHDASFELEEGAVGCLLGANGSGKTTMMRSLLGNRPIDGGDIQLAGRPLSHRSAGERAKIVAWVPQAHDGAFAFQVLDMVMMGASPHMKTFSVPGVREKALAHQKLAELGIELLADRIWSTLSGGERQLVLIARALMQNPQLLLMDEPAASLDFGHQITLLDTLNSLKSQGMTLLMATHHPMHARAVADTVILIHADGSVTQGPPAVQLSPESLAALYRVSVDEIRRHLGEINL